MKLLKLAQLMLALIVVISFQSCKKDDETTVEDVVEGLGVLIKSKELAHDEDAIRLYLWEELEIKSHFCTRTINRIIERALALGSDGIELVKRLERPDAIAWLNTKAKIKYTGEIDYDAKVE